MKHGHYVVGRLKGIKEKPWSSNQGSSTYLGVAVEYTDGYGEIKENTFEVTVYSSELQRASQLANQFRGQVVALSYLPVQKKSKTGNRWIENAFARDSDVVIADETQLKAAS